MIFSSASFALGVTSIFMLPGMGAMLIVFAILIATGGVTLTAPEIAENGNAVPITVDAPGASAIVIFAAGNPLPLIATFNFGPMAASREVSTRIRLAGTQDVVAIARMADGTYARAAKTVQVTIGGC